jgi:hypothetical protein
MCMDMHRRLHFDAVMSVGRGNHANGVIMLLSVVHYIQMSSSHPYIHIYIYIYIYIYVCVCD